MSDDEKLSIPPFRSFSDFFADTSCYSWPTFADSQRLQSRIAKNLLYYQTNYIVSAVVIFSLFWIKFPLSVSIGCLAFIGSIIATGYLAAKAQLHSNQRTRALPGWAVVLAAGGIVLLVLYYLVAILLFILAVGFPCVLVHASVRKRNLKNKFANKVETMGFKATPAGVILSGLGLMDTN